MQKFSRIDRLPPYVLNEVNELKAHARAQGEDIIDFGMGNPDQATPEHVVDKLIQTVKRGDTHRYSVSRGIKRLRKAICNWYAQRFDVDLDPEQEVLATIGSKQGLTHLALALTGPGDSVVVPNPAYPIHVYAFIIAGADVHTVPLADAATFLADLETAIRATLPKPKLVILNFPANPTTLCVDLKFFEKIVALAKTYDFNIIHDFAYAEIGFDGYQPPSILQVPGAKEVAVETYSLSKTYNMPGWRVGFVCGNPEIIYNVSRLKSYFDYGMFTPVQVAAIEALEGPQDCVREIVQRYQQRRDVLCSSLQDIGWSVSVPQATMFVWAKIPEHYRASGSMAFSKTVLQRAKVALSPGIGFGDFGDDHVRISLIENEHRIRQAARGLRKMFRDDGWLA